MQIKEKVISQEYLKDIIKYCPDSGDFTWIKKISKKITIGQKAGTIKLFHTGKTYLIIIINGYQYRAHRLAWLYIYGSFPKDTIDHEDGNGLNNKISNLKDKDFSENCKNMRLFSNNKTGVCGVFYEKAYDRFVSYININKSKKYLYRGVDFFEACCARKSANNKYSYHESHGSIRPL